MTQARDLLATIVVARSAELQADLEAKGFRPGHDSGSPMVSSTTFYSSGGIRMGVWECTPGGWHIENRPDTETMLLLKGHVQMTTDGADPVDIREGDVFVLPTGWSGRWDVLETTRKLFVVADEPSGTGQLPLS